MKAMLFRALALAAALACAPSFGQLKNGDFEIPDAANPAMPADWYSPEAGVIALDSTRAHSGERSVRLEKGKGQTTFLGQSLDARAWVGKLVGLRGWLWTAEASPYGGGLSIRADSKDKSLLAFTNDPTFLPAQAWTRAQAILEIPEGTAIIGVGVAWGGDGLLWADSMELFVVDESAPARVSDSVARYIDEAIEILRAHALYASRVDWKAARRTAMALADGADSPAQAHPSVSFLLRHLGDGHSFMISADRAKNMRGDSRADDFAISSRMVGRKGYVAVPAYVGTNAEREKAFAVDLRDRIAQQAREGACGWIVDLRRNGGGNMAPMVGGLGPLLGSVDLGFYVDRGGARVPWSVATFEKRAHVEVPEGLKRLRDVPVAVLLGPRTASSGEIVAVSFIGREKTRSFGNPTAGKASGNQGFTLSDGAMMLVTVATLADRNGKRAGERVSPDEAIEDKPGGDAVVDAAAAWLDRAPECRRQASR